MKKLFCFVLIAFAAIMLSVLVGKFSIPQISAEGNIADLPAPDIAQNIQPIDAIGQESDILLDFPMGFPRKMPFEVKIAAFPPSARYCMVSAGLGSVSDGELTLGIENSFVYSFPLSYADFEKDIIRLEFYDITNSLIDSSTVFVSYDEDEEPYGISGLLGQRLLTVSDPGE